MTATEFLRVQHQEALGMINVLQAGNGKKHNGEGLDKASLELFGKLKSALVFHTAVEEQVFYHELANNPQTQDLIHDALTEHRTVDQLLVKLSVSAPGDFGNHLAELKNEIAHHVDEEENDIFPKAERILGDEKLKLMGWQMEQLKKGKSANIGKPFHA